MKKEIEKEIEKEIDITSSDFPVLFCRKCNETYSYSDKHGLIMQEEAMICPNCKREGLTHLNGITVEDYLNGGMKMNKIKGKIEEGKEKVKEEAQKVDDFVKEKPYRSIGIVAGISGALGVMAGWYLGRKKKKND